MRQVLLLLTLAISITGVASAEDVSQWPLNKAFLQDRVDIVTLSEPGKKHRCLVQDLTEDSVTCHSRMGRKAVSYQRNDVASIIEPPREKYRILTWRFVGVGAALIVGSFFVPIEPLVIAMLAVGTYVICIPGFGDGDPSDHSNDILVYQQPETKLSVRLRN